MEAYEGILKLVGNELDAITKNGKFRSREEIDSTYKLIDIAKDIHCIWQYEDDESEYSETGMSYEHGGRSYRGSYDNGMSGARGRMNARRDSMGRYSRDDGYSYRDGGRRGMNYSYDGGKQEYIEELRDMMNHAPDEQTRQSIQRMIDNMK